MEIKSISCCVKTRPVRQQFESSIMPIDFEAIFGSIKGDVAVAVTNPLQNGFIA